MTSPGRVGRSRVPGRPSTADAGPVVAPADAVGATFADAVDRPRPAGLVADSLHRLAHDVDPLGGAPVPVNTLEILRRRNGRGRPLPEHVAGPIGQQLGVDLSAVRLHTDAEAAGVARSLQAAAFTHGTDVYLDGPAVGANGPSRVLAHELAHVAQQAVGTPAASGPVTVGRADDPVEREADRIADSVLRRLAGRPASSSPPDAGAGRPDPVRRWALLRCAADQAAPSAGRALTSVRGEQFSLVIRRKPADIDKTWLLAHDLKGNRTAAPAARAAGLGRTTVINAQLRDGWVTPKDKLVGGHLFKAELGGPDDETNVVPWSKAAEKKQGEFEDRYTALVTKEAKILANRIKAAKDKAAALPPGATPDPLASATTGFTATVTTKATFADRPDLQVSDADLKAAGWADKDPAALERKAKFDDVAERFSGIPTAVTVTVTGLPSGVEQFAPGKDLISPDFKRNDLAIRPDYVVPVRFKRNAVAPRKFAQVGDWKKAKNLKTKTAEQEACLKKLNHLQARHGAHFGVPGNSFEDLEKFEGQLSVFIAAPTTEQIEGMYMGDEVLHYVEHTSKVWVSTDVDGAIVAGFKLSDQQYNILLARGTVG